MRTRLTVNRQFMSDFLAAETPCFTLGLVEERKGQCRLHGAPSGRALPPAISDAGFRFGHSLYGNADFEAVRFAFQFYGFKTYNILVNPNNPISDRSGRDGRERRSFFFAVSDGSATAFWSEIG